MGFNGIADKAKTKKQDGRLAFGTQGQDDSKKNHREFGVGVGIVSTAFSPVCNAFHLDHEQKTREVL